MHKGEEPDSKGTFLKLKSIKLWKELIDGPFILRVLVGHQSTSTLILIPFAKGYLSIVKYHPEFDFTTRGLDKGIKNSTNGAVYIFLKATRRSLMPPATAAISILAEKGAVCYLFGGSNISNFLLVASTIPPTGRGYKK